MSWLSKLLGKKEEPEVNEEKPEVEEETNNSGEETVAKKSGSKRTKPTKKDSPPADIAKSTYIPVPDEDAKMVASNFGMLGPGEVVSALFIEQMPTKPFVVHGFIICVCTHILPLSLSVMPGLHTEHSITCPNCSTKISGSKGAVENFVIVTAGVEETVQQYKRSQISVVLDKVTNI